jgi:hypothetical protein
MREIAQIHERNCSKQDPAICAWMFRAFSAELKMFGAEPIIYFEN